MASNDVFDLMLLKRMVNTLLNGIPCRHNIYLCAVHKDGCLDNKKSYSKNEIIHIIDLK